MIAEHHLKHIHILRDLTSHELASLGSVMIERRFPKGSYIVLSEDPGPSIMFIAEGSVKVTLVSDDGKEVVVAGLSEGEFFGELAVLTGEDRSANVVAATDCRLFALSADSFRQHLAENSGLAFAMMKELALRLRSATAKIGDLALYDVYRRVARTLRSIAQTETVEGKEVLVIDQRPTHQELAALVGTSREMVTRALKGLEEDGCIILSGKRLEVRKMPI